MGLLDRILGVPDWARPLDVDEYSRFSSLLSRALGGRALPSHVRRGEVITTVDGQPSRLSFKTLARKCKLAPPATWEALIGEHLDVCLSPSTMLPSGLAEDFALARKFLKVQLVPTEQRREAWQEGVNFKVFSTGVLAVLVFDLPQSVITVAPGHVRAWGRPFSSLFDLAAEQVRADPELAPLECETQRSGCSIYRLTGESFFVCSQALWLDRFPEAQSERGVLVSIPSRHCVQFAAVDDNALTALEALALAGMQLYETLPGAVSSSIFWMKADQVVPIPVAKNEVGQLQVMPPSSLMEIFATDSSTARA